jgi:hypothetical protein
MNDMPTRSADAALIAALRDPCRYAHAVSGIELMETHISWVLLTGEFAYKIKKPVKLGFLDFTSLEARRLACEAELRLNRRTAPQLYLEVVPISGSAEHPLLSDEGTVVEYAVKMRQFPQQALLDRMARSGTLAAAHIDCLAGVITAFHARIARSGSDDAFGAPAKLLENVSGNFAEIRKLNPPGGDLAVLAELEAWTDSEHRRLVADFNARKRDGFVRECHGDLHLGNIALIDGMPTPFDCIEFNEDFRWNDVMSEIAFLAMDLVDHRLPGLAYRFLNDSLEQSGDYAGVRVLRFYLVYRALVRAKVSCIRAHQPGLAEADRQRQLRAFRNHLHLARAFARHRQPALILMHGLSGSGKTTVSQALLEGLGAIRVRSDVERKRLHGLAREARSASGVATGLYQQEASEQTYATLAGLARDLLESGYPVIVDAAFLRQGVRGNFRKLARDNGVPFVIVSCQAAESLLRERVARRDAQATDASEAGIAVLEHQLVTQEVLSDDESQWAVALDTGHDVDCVQAVAQRLDLATLPA